MHVTALGLEAGGGRQEPLTHPRVYFEKSTSDKIKGFCYIFTLIHKDNIYIIYAHTTSF